MIRRSCLKYILILLLFPIMAFAQNEKIPPPLKIGYSISIKSINLQKMQYAKTVGISSLQISLNPLVDKNGDLNMKDNDIQALVKMVKSVLTKSGIKVAAFHMPFGQHVDLSIIDENERQRVMDLHKKLLRLCAPLQPAVVLFHPSWYLSLNQRSKHITQLVKSVEELDFPIKALGAVMVIENMTGPKLHVTRKGVKYERPLCRTVSETKQIMGLLPSDVYAAVDMNHILHPEKLVLALGSRLKFIHVSDGDGAHERHYFPCSEKGMNDWMDIMDALYQVGYNGPFMFECHYKDVKDLMVCYRYMYNKYILEKYISPEYQK